MGDGVRLFDRLNTPKERSWFDEMFALLPEQPTVQPPPPPESYVLPPIGTRPEPVDPTLAAFSPPPPPARPMTIGAPTWTERINEGVRDIREGLLTTPAARIVLGLPSDIAEALGLNARPEVAATVAMGTVTPGKLGKIRAPKTAPVETPPSTGLGGATEAARATRPALGPGTDLVPVPKVGAGAQHAAMATPVSLGTLGASVPDAAAALGAELKASVNHYQGAFYTNRETAEAILERVRAVTPTATVVKKPRGFAITDGDAVFGPTGWTGPKGSGVSAGVQHAQMATPVGLETLGAPVVKPSQARLAAVTEALVPYDATQRAAVAQEIASAYPVLDAYTKPTAHLSQKMLESRAAGLSEPAQAVVRAVIANFEPGSRIAPAEMQSLSQGRPYVPSRVVRTAHRSADPTAKPLPGAPHDVTTKAHELTRLRNYLDLVREGLDGWDWYDKGGRAIMFAANDDPQFARQIAEVLSATSSATEVGVNTGFGVKAVQSRGADPSGRYPTAMGKKIAAVFNDEEFASGLKHTAFADALSRAGGFMSKHSPERPVNDIWQAEAWGYQNPDGTPLRRGWTDAEHAWMDRMSDRALAAVLRDPTLAALIPPEAGTWTLPRLQAAAWVGQKRRAAKAAAAADALAGKTNSGAAILGRVGEFGKAIEDTYAQQGRETVTGKKTRHLTELHGNTPQAAQLRDDLHELIVKESGIYDKRMRDQIMAHLNRMTGEAFEGVGVFENVIAPGVQTQVPVGTVAGPTGGRIIAPGSMQAMRAADAIYALHNAQAASAGGKVLQAAPGQIKDAANIRFGTGQLNSVQVQDILRRIAAAGGAPGSVVPIPTPTGIRLYNVPGKTQLPEKTFHQLVTDIHQAYGAGKASDDIFRGQWSGYFDTNKWNLHGSEFGQGFYPLIEPFKAEYDTFAPQLAQMRIAIEKELKTRAGGKLTQNPTQVYLHQTIANEGWKGLDSLAKRFGIPVALLAAMAGLATTEDGQEVAQ